MLFDGDAYSKQKESEIRKKRLHFGMVFQSFNLFPQYKVIENIVLAPQLQAKEQLKSTGEYMGVKSYKEAQQKIMENALVLLEKVGLSEKKDAYPCSLSGGQQQRVAIARALALNPDILCFDEPTSALDPISTSRIEDLAMELKEKYTIVIVTHNMQQAVRISDQTAFFLLGELVEYGDTEQLFSKPTDKRTEDYITGRFG